MSNKQNFKPDEWTKILEGTMLAGMAVTAAEPSGLWGALKEAFASSSALAAAKSNAGSNELVKSVVADFETKEGRSAVQEALRQHLAGAKPAEAVQRAGTAGHDRDGDLPPSDAAGTRRAHAAAPRHPRRGDAAAPVAADVRVLSPHRRRRPRCLRAPPLL